MRVVLGASSEPASHLEELARMNAGPARADHAILLGEHTALALQTLLESDKSRRMGAALRSDLSPCAFHPT